MRRSFTIVFAIGGAAAGLGGVLASVYYGYVSAHLGSVLLIFAFIVTVIGGLGSLTGAAIASVLVAVLQQFANFYLGGTGDLVVVVRARRGAARPPAWTHGEGRMNQQKTDAATPTATPSPRSPSRRRLGAGRGIRPRALRSWSAHRTRRAARRSCRCSRSTSRACCPARRTRPGTLQLLAYAMLIAALALSYRMMFGLAGLLSFGHALFFAAGAYGLGMTLDAFAPVEWPSELIFVGSIVVTLVFGIVLAATVGSLALRVTGISFAMVTLAFAQAGSVLIRRNPGGATGGDEGLSLDIDQRARRARRRA